jgi:hypothetical protein
MPLDMFFLWRLYPRLPNNWGSGHQIAKAQVGSLRGLGLASGAVPESRCQQFTHSDLNSGQADDGQRKHDGPDFEDAASEGVCFHGSNLALHASRVLIERNHPGAALKIDAADNMSNADDHRWDLHDGDKGYLPECDDAFEHKMEEWAARDWLD